MFPCLRPFTNCEPQHMGLFVVLGQPPFDFHPITGGPRCWGAAVLHNKLDGLCDSSGEVHPLNRTPIRSISRAQRITVHLSIRAPSTSMCRRPVLTAMGSFADIRPSARCVGRRRPQCGHSVRIPTIPEAEVRSGGDLATAKGWRADLLPTRRSPVADNPESDVARDE